MTKTYEHNEPIDIHNPKLIALGGWDYTTPNPKSVYYIDAIIGGKVRIGLCWMEGHGWVRYANGTDYSDGFTGYTQTMTHWRVQTREQFFAGSQAQAIAAVADADVVAAVDTVDTVEEQATPSPSRRRETVKCYRWYELYIDGTLGEINDAGPHYDRRSINGKDGGYATEAEATEALDKWVEIEETANIHADYVLVTIYRSVKAEP